ncbi:hypothetical protein DIZ76_010087 [Coccidioides immitis]|nr:hypothetical protein DIZ76_010087 [Coccidioides immitis]
MLLRLPLRPISIAQRPPYLFPVPSAFRRSIHQHRHRSPLRPAFLPCLRNPTPLQRHLHLPAILIPPLVFTGLFLTLWLYKCAMMIVFQNRIIYMPSMPPGARREKIEDYAGMCGGVRWTEKRIRARDGVELGLCVGESANSGRLKAADTAERHVVILYFQGNASSLPPRLPLLSGVLKDLERGGSDPRVKYTFVALSYRGYWTSRGRASQKGIELDALAALDWIHEEYFKDLDGSTTLRRDHGDTVVLWGQSIGAGVATGLAAHQCETKSNRRTSVGGLILETPFLSVQSMLVALYPQRWLPYRYLWPFLRNWWDSEAALKRTGVALQEAGRELERGSERKMRVLIVSAANDELVPGQQSDRLEEICGESGLDVQRQRVAGALHTDATVRAEGRNAVVRFLKEVGER